jgi:hypothetical protein
MKTLLNFLAFASLLFPSFQSQVRIPGPGGSGGGPTFVQSCTNDGGKVSTQTNLTCTFSAGTTAGDGVLVFVFNGTSGSTPVPATGDVSDASSDTFTYVNNMYSSLDTANAAMYLTTTATAGTTVVTYNCLARTSTLKCGGFEGIVAFELKGGQRLSDGSATINSTTGTTAANGDVCTSFTTLQNGDFIAFGATDITNNTTTFTAGTSPLTFTVPSNATSPNLLAEMEYGYQSTAGAINPAFTANTSHHYGGVCMAVK